MPFIMMKGSLHRWHKVSGGPITPALHLGHLVGPQQQREGVCNLMC